MTATSESQETSDQPLHQPNIVLDVRNFGPIAEAKDIEFRPMTVFVGPATRARRIWRCCITH